MRWDLNTPVFEEQDRLNYGFDTTTHQPGDRRASTSAAAERLPGARRTRRSSNVDGNPKYPYQYDKNNIQPRVGFAYQLNDKTVVRGGYGLYYINVVGISVVERLRRSRRR